MFQQLRFLLLATFATSCTAYVSVVSGANGFVGRHVVYSLLQKSNDDITGSNTADQSSMHTVVCLVRPDKVPYEESYWNAHLENIQQSSGSNAANVCVKVMPYDMLNGETLYDALEAGMENAASSKDCPVCIYHIASVFGPTPDPIETANDNVQSAEITVNVLDKFYRRYPDSKPRLILTSSMAGVRATDQTPLNGKHYTHRDWNTLSKLNADNWGSCYQWSKAESERRAWELVKECNEKYANEDGNACTEIEMVALCPSFVFGPPPPLPSKMNDVKGAGSSSYSLTLINQWIEGKSQVQSRLCVDVRDVADAHLAAGFMTNLPKEVADRRYILSTEERLSSELTAEALKRGVELAQKKDGENTNIDLSGITCDTTFTGGAIKIGEREVEASERLEHDLGVVCRPVEETMRDMAEALLHGQGF